MRKRRERPPDWRIIFEDCGALKSVVDTVATVTPKMSVRVTRDETGGAILKVDSADVAFMCCVSARLKLDAVEFPGGDDNATDELSFCVDCKHVAAALDSPSFAHLSLRLEGDSATNKVRIRMVSPDVVAHECRSELDTYVEEEGDVLREISYRMLVELDLSVMRELLKKARKTHAENLTLEIYTRDFGAKKVSLVAFYLPGGFRHEVYLYNEVLVDDDGSMVVRAAADGAQGEFDIENDTPAFHGTYVVEKLDAFIKNLNCRILTAKVKTGAPLLLEHRLGGSDDDQSHIRYLIAPVNEE